jgi:hypothetical protein
VVSVKVTAIPAGKRNGISGLGFSTAGTGLDEWVLTLEADGGALVPAVKLGENQK